MNVFFALGMSTASKLTRKKREVTWEDVIFSLSSLTVEKEKLVKDMCSLTKTPNSFLELTERAQIILCTECGVEGWEEAFVGAIMGQVRVLSKVHMHMTTLCDPHIKGA